MYYEAAGGGAAVKSMYGLDAGFILVDKLNNNGQWPVPGVFSQVMAHHQQCLREC